MARPETPTPLLQVNHLQTHFFTDAGVVKSVEDVTFSLGAGETLAVVGESGSGKSVTSLSIMGLIANPPGQIVGGAANVLIVRHAAHPDYEFRTLAAIAADQKRTPVEQFIQIVKDGGASIDSQ